MMQDPTLLVATLEHLRALVAFDTRNPPRAIDTGGIFDYLRARLPGFDVRVTDHGAGAVSLYAIRGRPKLLFNVHLDTVPDSPHWTASPFDLRIADDHAVGLGACDIKGAAAVLLAVANATGGDMALLLTTDEEGADPRCINAFLNKTFSPLPSGEGALQGRVRVRGTRDAEVNAEPSPEPLPPAERGFIAVIVAEPTRCAAVLTHRGIQSLRVSFAGRAGHASREQLPLDSALHQAIRWGAAALDFAEAQAAEAFDGLHGLRFNIGRVEGGIKANIIAPDAEVRIGVRPLPSMDMDDLAGRLRTLNGSSPAHFEETFRGPPLPADTAHATARQQAARALADALHIPVGNAVDFWTEASLFSKAGYTAIVCGPGDIAQAHSSDEWVALDQLRSYAEAIHRIVAGGAS